MLFRLSNITKSYGGAEILRGVSFQVNPSEKVGLVGRNGSGKTTIFRLLTGGESPDSGEVVKAGALRLGLLDQHVDFQAGETVHTAALSAFKEIHDIEAEMRRLEKHMETDHSEAVLDKYADLQHAFELSDGFSYAAKAEAILLGLGFSIDSWGHDTATLSGGQKNRLGMARLLLSNSDVLLLDEPTNHLDVNAVEWLEGFLQTYDKAYVVISHDRYFLDRTTNRVIELDRGFAVTYKGNYSKYLVERELRREQQQREYENQQQLINKTEEFIRRNLEGQKTKQAKSRRTMLAKMERIDAVRSERSGGNFRLKNVERAGNNVLTAEDLAVGYGRNMLASGINILLHRGEVLGIMGGNGTGKTTLLRTLLGEIRELAGTVTWGTKTNIGYYSQTLGDLHDGNDVISELRRVAPLVESGELRSFLARFLFVGDDIEKKVSDLSGGEKGRLALAKLIYSQKNVLVLDEPTNHLDIPAREALESALDEYPGTIVVVSHDRFFLDKIVTQIISFEAGGEVLAHSGSYTDFHEWRTRMEAAIERIAEHTPALIQHVSGGKPKQVTMNAHHSEPETRVERTPSKLSKNERQKYKTRIAEIEMIIPQLEKDAAELTLRMSRPEIAADFARLNELAEKHRTIESRIQKLYTEWQEAADKLD